MSHPFQQGAFVNEAVKDRQRMSRKQTEREEAVAARRARAWRMGFDKFPQLRCGTASAPSSMSQPCPWLVWAICNVWDRDGEGKARASVVLAERARLLPRDRVNEEAPAQALEQGQEAA